MKRNSKILSTITSVLVVSVGLFYLYQNHNYNIGLSAFNAQNYQYASYKFHFLKNFKNSEDMVQKCQENTISYLFNYPKINVDSIEIINLLEQFNQTTNRYSLIQIIFENNDLLQARMSNNNYIHNIITDSSSKIIQHEDEFLFEDSLNLTLFGIPLSSVYIEKDSTTENIKAITFGISGYHLTTEIYDKIVELLSDYFDSTGKTGADYYDEAQNRIAYSHLWDNKYSLSCNSNSVFEEKWEYSSYDLFYRPCNWLNIKFTINF